MKIKSLVCLVILVLAATVASASVADFENLSLGDDSHWSGTYPYDNGNNTSETVGIQTGDATFTNTSGYAGYYFWNGWAYSNETDSTTPGYTNQFSAYVTDGEGHAYNAGDNNYGVFYNDFASTVSFDEATISGMWVTNTTYAYLSMANGDWAAKKFGGVSGDDEDEFVLTFEGFNGVASIGTVDFHLADFTFADNSQDYIVDEWTWVELSGLGDITSLAFSFTSTDNDPTWGMNTPGYFAMDNFNGSALQAPVPEPITIALLGLGGLLLRRKKA